MLMNIVHYAINLTIFYIGKESITMNVNGITTNGYDNAAYTDTAVKNSTNKDNKTSTASFSKDAAVYEASSRTTTRQKSNAAVVAQMKQDLADRTGKMKSLVSDMFLKQGKTFASSEDMIKALAMVSSRLTLPQQHRLRRISPRMATGELSRPQTVFLILHRLSLAATRIRCRACLRHSKRAMNRLQVHGARSFLHFARIPMTL